MTERRPGRHSKDIPFNKKEYRASVEETLKGKFTESEIALMMHDYDYAVAAHGNQKRDERLPYLVHLVGAMRNYVAAGGRDVDVVRMCFLHDVKEDTLKDVTAEEFGPEVAEGVAILTKPKRKEVRPQTKRRVREVSYERLDLAIKSGKWRAGITKLTERLDNVNTLGPLSIKRHSDTIEITETILMPIFEKIVDVSSEPDVVRNLIDQLKVALSDAKIDLEEKKKERNERQKRKNKKR